MIRFLFLLPLLCGCAPRVYVFGGAGYSLYGGEYYFEHNRIDETGSVGVYGIGLEFSETFDCKYHHRSMITRKPEFVANDVYCEVKHYIGEGQ